ncbi:Spx/MgsR family RNA polymerase-binding regulatory protein [Mollicutes bacterium LVI A0078]|nr:Spx/MgsR family RNA polymerase-binding regulatory protein [Mollicutes bacterium LVI A0075]WOO90306.1 Spx/MgsR family RNA polymerase-binding regulatory protein [Mollicutes bacterium LVI A0078]
MLTIYTSYNCASCKKAMAWLHKHGIAHEEYNFFSRDLTQEEVRNMLKFTSTGFEDIVSERSKIYTRYKDAIVDMKTSELITFIIENPSILKRPILVDDVTESVKVGFNEEDLNEYI